jgi:hypothetical protein
LNGFWGAGQVNLMAHTALSQTAYHRLLMEVKLAGPASCAGRSVSRGEFLDQITSDAHRKMSWGKFGKNTKIPGE